MKKVKFYKCPVCNKQFKTLDGFGSHMRKFHPGIIPSGWTDARYYYYLLTNKEHGTCIICKNNTDWNEATMKYNRFCNNPKCKEIYKADFRKKMISKYGKISLLDDPEQQRKMLANKKISGKYKFSDGGYVNYTGTYEKDFLYMLDKFLNLNSGDVMGPSPHTYRYFYKNPEDKENEGEKFYIPDFYIPSLNLEIEIKQNTNTHPKLLKIDHVKELEKDDLMNHLGNINYIKLVEKNYEDFFTIFLDLKENIDIPGFKLPAREVTLKRSDIEANVENKEIVTEGIMTSSLSVAVESSYDISSNKQIYHLSEENLDGKILTPRVPHNSLTKRGWEDGVTPRISFSLSVQGSLVGISNNLKGKEFYIHIPDTPVKYYKPSKKEVPDAKCSHEVWVQEPVKLKVYKKIKITSAQDNPLKYKLGNINAEAYKWNYNYITLESYANNSIAMEAMTSVVKSDYVSKGNKSLTSFIKKVCDDGEFEKWHQQFPSELKHVRVNENCVLTLWLTKDEKLVAYICLESIGDDTVIQALEVLPEFRGCGLSKQLLKYAKINNANLLYVDPDNKIAIKVYKDNGWKFIENKNHGKLQPMILTEALINFSSFVKESASFINDKGEKVPKICPECGSKVGVFIKGEPVYLCTNKDCHKYFGTVQ